MNLVGKSVLLIAPSFFGYEIEIQDEIRRRGADLDYLADRPYNKAWQTALTRFAPMLIQPWVNRLYKKLLNSFSTPSYDLILVINGQTLSLDTLLELKMKNPKAKTILYMWDSIKNRPRVLESLQHYDHIYSFDSEDAEKFSMVLRPLFFTKGFEPTHKAVFKYDLSFVGTIHSDRYEVIKKIQSNLDVSFKCFWYLYLQAKWVLWAFKFLKPHMRSAQSNEFQFCSIEKGDLQNVFLESKAIVDIEHPKQNGLTMRTFETIGACKKLITTNSNIRNYDFFCEENICVINRKHPTIPANFLRSEYKPLPTGLVYKYSISGWLDQLIQFESIKDLK
jgi:hypothetical protein